MIATKSTQPRHFLIRAGTVTIRAQLLDTPTARRFYEVLPIRSTAETWGCALHFDTDVETGLEADAVLTVKPGQIAFCPEREMIAVAFGPTPISALGEIRLWCPSNIFAKALDDVSALAAVQAGQQVDITALSPEIALATAPR